MTTFVIVIIGALALGGLTWFAFGTRDTSGSSRGGRRSGAYGAAGGATFFGGDGSSGDSGGHDGGASCGGGSSCGGGGCGGGGAG